MRGRGNNFMLNIIKYFYLSFAELSLICLMIIMSYFIYFSGDTIEKFIIACGLTFIVFMFYEVATLYNK